MRHVGEVGRLLVLGVDGSRSRVERWSWNRFNFEGAGDSGRRKSVGRRRGGEVVVDRSGGGRRGGGLHVEGFENGRVRGGGGIEVNLLVVESNRGGGRERR